MTEDEWPYNLPIWRSSLRLASPDGEMIAEIKEAHEISMGDPTIGSLVLSSGIEIERCNPSFIWSDDSVYLAVPQYSFSRFWGIGRQRLLIVDAIKKKGWQSPKLAHYIQPEKFEGGRLTITLNPFSGAKKLTYSVPRDLTGSGFRPKEF